MSLIVNMEMPPNCWECEFFDDLYINFNGMEPHNTEMGWCRLCKKEIAHIDYKQSKPGWCTLVQIPSVLEDNIKLMLGII